MQASHHGYVTYDIADSSTDQQPESTFACTDQYFMAG